MTAKNINFSTLFGPAQIYCGLSDGRLDHTIHQLIARISDIERSIDIEGVYQLLLSREDCGIMSIQPGVAVVHVRVEGLKQLRIALATSRNGFTCSPEQHGFKCVENGSDLVNIAVFMMAPTDDPTSYLRAIVALKIICKREGFVEQLLTLEHPETIWALFEKTDERLPDYIEAHHIMRSNFSRLLITDNLSQAIELFCNKSIGEFPVVDADGDLVGVVSEEELIRLCLPEYITWMEELAPILNFEPFAEILQREKNMPVMEIMVLADRYTTVNESTPAIQVAKVTMRRDVRQVFVVRNNKLMGVISIKDLIQEVLRG